MVQTGAVHRHYKGGKYIPLGIVRNSEQRDQLLVVYVSLDRGSFWARPLNLPRIEGDDCWEDGVVWPDGITRQRFIPESNLSSKELDKLCMEWNGRQ